MDYTQTLKYLYTLRKTGIKLRLSHTQELLRRMGNPHEDFSSVHVGGTNGKGSVCAMVYSTLMDAGSSAGLYTSPHLMEFTERINVDGEDIPRGVLARMLEETIPLIDGMRADEKIGEPTFFEVVTSIAFKYFAEQEVEIAVVEVGLGGRLDATNVLTPEVSVITNIQLDHTEILGNSMEDIAREKAGIIKEKAPLITAELNPKALAVFEETCKKKNAELHVVGGDITYTTKNTKPEAQAFDVQGLRTHKNLKIRLLGRHQIVNATTAVSALDALNSRGIEISPENIRRGLSTASWPGRFEVLETKPKVILDCAHNPAGTETLTNTLKELYPNKKPIFVLGMSDYKDIDGILAELTPLMKTAVTAKSQHPQAIAPEKLCKKISEYKIPCTQAASVEGAITKARELAEKDDLIVFAGSIFFVGDARKILIT